MQTPSLFTEAGRKEQPAGSKSKVCLFGFFCGCREKINSAESLTFQDLFTKMCLHITFVSHKAQGKVKYISLSLLAHLRLHGNGLRMQRPVWKVKSSKCEFSFKSATEKRGSLQNALRSGSGRRSEKFPPSLCMPPLFFSAECISSIIWSRLLCGAAFQKALLTFSGGGRFFLPGCLEEVSEISSSRLLKTGAGRSQVIAARKFHFNPVTPPPAHADSQGNVIEWQTSLLSNSFFFYLPAHWLGIVQLASHSAGKQVVIER